jgi:hypothetical protein
MEMKMTAFWEQHWFPHLRELVDDAGADYKKLAKYTTYIYWADKANLDLNFTLSAEEKVMLNSVQDLKMYYMHLADQ